MRMTVRFENGGREDALLLAVGQDRARVVVAGRGATEEWVVLDGQFHDEAGRPVEIEFVEAVEDAGYGSIRTLAAGSAAN